MRGIKQMASLKSICSFLYIITNFTSMLRDLIFELRNGSTHLFVIRVIVAQGTVNLPRFADVAAGVGLPRFLQLGSPHAVNHIQSEFIRRIITLNLLRKIKGAI